MRTLRILYIREEFPLFGEEGSGEIFITICLSGYGFFSVVRFLIDRVFFEPPISKEARSSESLIERWHHR
jgi:hypothetical protein